MSRANRSQFWLEQGQGFSGFTRLELLAVLGAIALLAAVTVPVLAANRRQVDRLGCASNLRQIVQAYHLWGNDHGGALPSRTSSCTGGLLPECMMPELRYIDNGWFHYAWISNELVSARLLACPGDTETIVATDFSASPQHGFLHPSFRSRALSYTAPLDVYAGQSQLFVSSDRNLSVYGFDSCSSGVSTAASIYYGLAEELYWEPGPHGQSGNLALYDGRVLQTSSKELDRYLRTIMRPQWQHGIFHVLLPRY